MRRCRVVQLLFVAFVVTAPVHSLAQSPESARGQALYETRCRDCHGQSVHERNPRAARTVAEIREFVVRWDRELGALWRDDELDAVTRYLNERYYHFPCPTSLCSLERVQARNAPVPYRVP